MTLQVNLLPAEYQQRTQRARRFRMWIALSIAMGVAQVMSGMYLRFRADETRNTLGSIAEMQEDQRKVTKQLASLTAQKRVLTRRVALAAQLRRKHRWSHVFATLADQLPDRAVLTRLASDPTRDDGMRSRITPRLTKKSKGSGPGGSVAKGLFIDGLATDHDTVAEFLGRLDDRSGLGTCELRSTSRQPFMNGHAVAFKIYTGW